MLNLFNQSERWAFQIKSKLLGTSETKHQESSRVQKTPMISPNCFVELKHISLMKRGRGSMSPNDIKWLQYQQEWINLNS